MWGALVEKVNPASSLEHANSVEDCMTLRLALPFVLLATAALAQPSDEMRKQVFLAADTNGDLVLSPAEFRPFMDALADAGLPIAKRVRFFGIYKQAFGSVDANGDGAVTPDELRASGE